MKTTQLLHRIRGTVDAVFHSYAASDDNLNQWRWVMQYRTAGLPVSVRRHDYKTMQALVIAGFLSAYGQTSGRTYQLTAMGQAATTACELPELRKLMAKLGGMHRQAARAARGNQVIIPGWRIVPSAGAGWSSVGNAYWSKLDAALKPTAPLMHLFVAGFIRTVHSTGLPWGVQITQAGHAALQQWPDAEQWAFRPPDMTDAEVEALADSWATGWDEGIDLGRRAAPLTWKNEIGLSMNT